MEESEILFFIDDDFAVGIEEPFLSDLYNKLKENSNLDIMQYDKMDDALLKGMNIKGRVKYCILDPLLNNAGLNKTYLIDSTLFNIHSLLSYCNEKMKIIILTSLHPDAGGEELKKRAQIEYSNNVIGFLYKTDFIKSHLLTHELVENILQLIKND